MLLCVQFHHPDLEMAISTKSPAPYAPPSAVLDVIQRYRDKGLQSPITTDVLLRAGVTDSLVRRTLLSLEALELVDPKGMPSPTLEKLRVAPQKDFQQALADWVKAAYAEVFQFVDPGKDDETAIRDAFRLYQPHGQQSRMVALFMGLCVSAGLAGARKTEASPRIRQLKVTSSSADRRTERAVKNVRALHGLGMSQHTGNLPPALAGIMASIPAQGETWTQATRDKFIKTFVSVLDFVVPVGEPQTDDNDN